MRSKILILLLCIPLLVMGSSLSYQDHSVPPAKRIPTGPDTISVVLIGDIMMHQKQLDYDHRTFLEPIRPSLEKADLAIANLEFTLAGAPYSGYPAFSSPDSYAEYIADCGVDVFLTANNHIYDKGAKGLSRTIDVYDRMREEGRIHYTGIATDEKADKDNNPLIMPVKGIRIALVNFTYGTNTKSSAKWPKINMLEKEEIHNSIQRAKDEGADLIIALPHWGVEYNLKHSRSQQDLARYMVEEGADLVVGAHPHVIQDTTHIDGVPVIYSMGNAVSNMSAKNTRLELMVKVNIVRGKDGANAKILEPELEFMWCTLPGTLTDSYATIPLKDYLGKKELWKQTYDYDNMVSTYENVLDGTGIEIR